jgi:hypothetical protein
MKVGIKLAKSIGDAGVGVEFNLLGESDSSAMSRGKAEQSTASNAQNPRPLVALKGMSPEFFANLTKDRSKGELSTGGIPEQGFTEIEEEVAVIPYNVIDGSRRSRRLFPGVA